jgi:hypothetical protein
LKLRFGRNNGEALRVQGIALSSALKRGIRLGTHPAANRNRG